MKKNVLNRKPTLCLDFDGVIHSYTSGWLGADKIPDMPVPGAIEFIARATEEFVVCIYSSRSSQPGGIAAMKNWLHYHAGSRAWITDKVFWSESKPAAMVTIDDRALTFTGVWPELKDLKAFKPWNKK